MKDHDGGGPLRACWRYQAKIGQDIKVVSQTTKGSFKKYVDKMRWVAGQKMFIFIHLQSKNIPHRDG